MTAACVKDSKLLTLPAGMRSTRAVQALLRVLPAQPDSGWTEALLETALHQQGIAVNKVTVYRALDRLAQAGVVHCTVDRQRTTRYWVAGHTATAASAHLECTGCHQSLPLDAEQGAVQSALQALRDALSQSTGLHNPQLDVAVHGECTRCANTPTHTVP